MNKKNIDPYKLKLRNLIWLLLVAIIILLAVALTLNLLGQANISLYLEKVNKIKIKSLKSNIKIIDGSYAINYLPMMGFLFGICISALCFYFVSAKNTNKEIISIPFIALFFFMIIAIFYTCYSVISSIDGMFFKIHKTYYLNQTGEINKERLAIYGLVKNIFDKNIAKNLMWAYMSIFLFIPVLSGISLLFAIKLKKSYENKNIAL